MPAIHDTYCQVEFLDHFYQMGPFDDDDQEMLRRELRKLIHQKSNLIVNRTNAELKDLAATNPYYKTLIKSSVSGGSQIFDLTPEQFSLQVTDSEALIGLDPRSVLLHHIVGTFMRSTTDGYQLLNSNDASWKETLSGFFMNKDYSLSVHTDKHTFPGWDVFREMNLPVSDVVISDQYILDDKNTFGANIFAILLKMLPSSLSKGEFNISIITKKTYDHMVGVSHKDPMEDAYSALKVFLNNLAKPYPINLGIYAMGQADVKLHDRDIITNYYWIKSGHSFDFYNSSGRLKSGHEGSTVSIKSIGICRETTDILLAQMKERRLTALKKNLVYGADNNRLLH